MVVDPEMAITAWNRRAEDMWGLRSDEAVGQHFLNLDIGLPIDTVKTPVRSALSGSADGAPLQVEAVNRRGRTITVKVTCAPLSNPGQEPAGVIILIEET